MAHQYALNLTEPELYVMANGLDNWLAYLKGNYPDFQPAQLETLCQKVNRKLAVVHKIETNHLNKLLREMEDLAQ